MSAGILAAGSSEAEGRVCRCVKVHVPKIWILHSHHIWPLATGGPDEPWNRLWLCPSTHNDVHDLLRQYRRHKGLPPGSILSRYGLYARVVAQDGWRLVTKANTVERINLSEIGIG